MTRVAFITAIFGGYDATCKPFAKQTIDTDFICFTDNPDIENNGWEIDTHPYHDTHTSPIDNGCYINSINKEGYLKRYENKHTFNTAKYYKQAFNNIPRLKEYDVIIWIDGSIEITACDVSEYMLELCFKYNIVSWHHEYRGARLIHEVEACYLPRYLDKSYLNQLQPYQDIVRQYHEYIREGYDEDYWAKVEREEGRGGHGGNFFGIWLTCFVAFNNKNLDVDNFLKLWYLQTLKHTTQDQISFPKVVQDTGIIPYTLPDSRFKGDAPHYSTDVFIKHTHSIGN